MDIAMEVMASPVVASETKVFSSLYNDVINKAKTEDKEILRSKGDITALSYYDNISDSIHYLTDLLGSSSLEEMQLMIKLHTILINERENFEFGFKFDVDVIKATYISMAHAIVDLICICIVSYVEYLQSNPASLNSTRTKNSLVVCRSVKSFIKMYEKGDWGKVVYENKKRISKGALGTVLAWGLLIIGATAALLWAIRGAVYLYYQTAANTKEKVDAMASFIEAASEEEKTGSIAQIKQKRMLDRLSSISEFLRVKILKADIAAGKSLEQSNKTEFTAKVVKADKVVSNAKNSVELY